MRHFPLVGLVAISLLSNIGCGDPSSPQANDQTSSNGLVGYYDVIVVGAGTGGSAAAIQAARMGARVLLLEETDCVGGQMNCAGVSNMDEGLTEIRQEGLYREFAERIAARYGSKPIGTCYWDSAGVCFEPKVGQEVLRAMLREANVQLLERQEVIAFTPSGYGPYVQTRRGDFFQARAIIDATEYGDVLALSGAEYRLGNGRGRGPNGGSGCVQDITYSAVIKKYDSIPDWARFQRAPPGYDAQLTKFRHYIAKGGSRWGAPNASYPYDWPSHSAYRGMPDSSRSTNYTGAEFERITKTGINWANDYPYSASAFDRGQRKAVNCEAKLHTLQFLYYAQTELGESSWGIADDEAWDTPWNREENDCPNIPAELKPMERRMPPIPYVRESRRAVGPVTLTGRAIKRKIFPGESYSRAEAYFPDSIAVGQYPVDLHACDGLGTLEPDLESTTDIPAGFVGGPFEIPASALVSQEVDGLILAEKNISQSRLANGATRLQPSTLLVGQAAGTLAALAARYWIPPRHLPKSLVQEEVLKQNSRVSHHTFSDVPRGSQYWAAVQAISSRGDMTGYGAGRFGPNDVMPRWQAAVALVRRFKLARPAPGSSIFADVSAAYSQPDVDALWNAGITKGCFDDGVTRRFCPTDSLTRAQLAVLLARAGGYAPVEPSWGLGTAFSDVPTTHWAYGHIQALAARGLVTGCSKPGQFCPEETLTRGEAALIFKKF